MKKNKCFAIVILIVMIGLLCINFGSSINKVVNQREVVVTVTDKSVKPNNPDDSRYLVYTKNEKGNIEVFEITDSLFVLRFDSSDIYAGIEVGKTYKFNIRGARIKILSWYPNIYGYKEVENL